MSLVQYAYRFFNDDGGEATSTPYAAENTNITWPVDTNIRLRVGITHDGDAAPDTSKYVLLAAPTGTSKWFEVKESGSAKLRLSKSAGSPNNIPDGGQDTTNRLTAPTVSPSPTFTPGRILDDESGQDDVPIGNGQFTELEFCLSAISPNGAVNGDIYDFRVYRIPAPSVVPGTAPSIVKSVENLAAADTGAVDFAFTGDVTAGNLIVLGAWGRAGGGDVVYTAGMVTQIDGTATLGTVALDAATVNNDPTSDSYPAGCWSVPVTGTGTLTLRITINGWAAGSTRSMGEAFEVTDVDVSGTRVNATNTATGTNTTAASTGNVATGGAGIIFGVLAAGSPGATNIVEDGAFTLQAELQANAEVEGSIITQAVTVDTTDAAEWTITPATYPAMVAVAYKSSNP